MILQLCFKGKESPLKGAYCGSWLEQLPTVQTCNIIVELKILPNKSSYPILKNK